jgi:hypothetical protein
MGVPRLTIKKELNYRRGRGRERCANCGNFAPNPPPLGGFRSVDDGRCKIIGLKPGRAYRILPDQVCDRFDETA